VAIVGDFDLSLRRAWCADYWGEGARHRVEVEGAWGGGGAVDAKQCGIHNNTTKNTGLLLPFDGKIP
jgi:hypothetical protein